MKNTIGIVGQGLVGTAVNEGLSKFYNICTILIIFIITGKN